MTPQDELEELLKKKGIGPEGSKSLKEEELSKLGSLLLNESVSLTTKSTILTALIILPPTEPEKQWMDKIKVNYKKLPEQLHLFFQANDHPYSDLIHKILRKESLTREEAEKGMSLLFEDTIEDCYKASFLEGERLKRESFEENKTFFNFLYNRIPHHELAAPILIDICDNYDGSNRTRNFSLFTAALLGASGFPTMVHGLDSVAPKFGYTPHQILKAAGKNPFIKTEDAVKNLSDTSIGWAYLDQQVYFPELYKLNQVRKEMVKRPFLATFEKLLQPIRSSEGGNYIVTGFTHAHYKSEIALQLKEQGLCRQAMVLKGSEGSSQMSLSKDTICVLFDGKEINESSLHPDSFGIPSLEAKQDKSISAEQCLKEGLEVLNGKESYARQHILYHSTAFLSKFNILPADEALSLLKTTLDSGKALKAWNMGNV